MIVNCKYFELKKEKSMQDGHFISSKQKLLYICTEENQMQFETFDDTDIKRIFWANTDEVEFLEEKSEDWSEEKLQKREREINGNWL
ncbi:MAG TPA: hypothetical protein VMZ91_14460 [Candidatus Paceibacterota bacterium]|nr:hypothetical protein [Candidatus Paceibacterota bacterium]